ncbi:MAG: hypothetical protein KJ060_07950 [Candidatus Hydrogenedentes bacterium]|nr:hypothetical protein [Candidatus Hydrogenedentota bacterium]
MTLLQYPGHALATLTLIAVIGLFVLAFRTDHWRQLKLVKWVIPALQLIPVVLLVVLLWDPARAIIRSVEQPNTVLVAFDTSESMSVEDMDGFNRLDAAIAAFETTFAPGAEDRPRYLYYGFDGTLHEVASAQSLPRWGYQTSIKPVAELLGRYAPAEDADKQTEAVGAIVFTDGQALEKNVSAIAATDHEGFQILIVGMGSDASHADIVVEGLDAPPRLRLDATGSVAVRVAGTPPDDSVVHLELRIDDLPLATRDLSGAEVAQGATVDFPVPADTLGVHTLEARATSEVIEITKANNARQATFEVVDEPRLRVLFYSQWASFDIGKLRQVLESEKKVSLNFVMDALLDGPDRGRGPYRIPQPEQSFPADAETLFEYDVVVLGPCNPRDFTSAQLENLYNFVAERGGGLLLIPGQDEFDLAQSREPMLKALMPGTLSPEQGRSAGPAQSMEVTPEGAALGLTTAGANADDPVELQAYYAVTKKPAATTAATLSGMPAIVSHRVGRGNVALLNLRHLYRLYREDEEGGALRSLASGLVTHLGAAVHEESRVQLLAQRASDDPRVVRFTAIVRDALYKPESGATVLLHVNDNVTRMDPANDGEYQASVQTAGEETLVARAEAAEGGVFIGETTVAARLPMPRGEMDRVQRNREFMEAMADQLNADYVDVEKLSPADAERFPAISRVDRVSEIRSAWRNWVWLGALCALLTLGWFVRRLAGMV